MTASTRVPVPSQRKARTSESQRGFSLVEICTVLAVLGTLACSAWPQLGDLLEKTRLQGRSQELVGDLLQLRSLAISKNQDLRISVHSDAGGSCYVLHTGGPKDCRCSSEGATWCASPSTTALKAVAFPAASGMTLHTSAGSILFDPLLGGAAPGGTIRLTDGDGREIRHVVSVRGRIRTCSTGPDGLGQPRC